MDNFNWVPLANPRELHSITGIYVVRHKDSGREYIGQGLSVLSRLLDHSRASDPTKYLYRAINKHGVAAFDCCVLLECDESELNVLEVAAIESRNTLVPHGFNLTKGGGGSSGYSHTMESRLKMAESQRGRKHLESTKVLISQSQTLNNSMAGVKLSDIRKAEIGAFSVRHHTGLIRSAEARKNISIGRLGKGLGKPMTEATKHAISKASKGVPKPWLSEMLKGVGNPMYGKASGHRKAILLWEGDATVPRLFSSLLEVSAFIGLSISTVSAHLKLGQKVWKDRNVSICLAD